MGILRDLVTRWRYDVDTSGLNRAEKSLQRVGKSLRGNLDTKPTSAMGSSLGGLAASLAGMRMAAIGVGAAVAGAAAGIGLLGKRSLEAAGDMEQNEIAFTTMLKSAEKAKTLIGEIQKFAATTPFEQGELIAASKTLLAFGTAAEQIIPTMTRLGNIAAGVGKERLPNIVRAFGRMQVKGRVSMEELNIFLEAGIPILDELAKQAGVTKEALFKMVEGGAVRFEQVNKAVTALSTGNGIFAGLMIEQSKSLFGILSNISDYFSILATKIGTAVLPIAKELAKTFLAWVTANEDFIKTEAANLLTMIAESAMATLKAFKAMTPYIKTAWDWFGGLTNVLRTLWSMGPVAQFMSIADSVRRIASAFGLSGDSMKGFSDKFAGFLRIVKIAGKVISILARLPALLIDDFAGFLEGKDSVFGKVVDFFQGIAQKIADFFKAAIDAPITFIKDMIGWLRFEFEKLLSSFLGFFGIKFTPFENKTDEEKAEIRKLSPERKAFAQAFDRNASKVWDFMQSAMAKAMVELIPDGVGMLQPAAVGGGGGTVPLPGPFRQRGAPFGPALNDPLANARSKGGIGLSPSILPRTPIGPSQQFQAPTSNSPASLNLVQNNNINASGLSPEAAKDLVVGEMAKQHRETIKKYQDISEPKIRE